MLHHANKLYIYKNQIYTMMAGYKSFLLFFIILPAALASCLKETVLPVKVSFEHRIEGDYQTTPVVISITNATTGADFYEWTFEGGTPAGSKGRNPGKVTFSSPGEHRVTLHAWNDTQEDTGHATVRVDSAVSVGFDYDILINDFAPAEVRMTNTTGGAGSYEWAFEGADPERSGLARPGIIRFAEGGTYKVTLRASNGSEWFTMEKLLTLKPRLSTDFSLTPIPADMDMQAPVTVVVKNRSSSYLNHRWLCEGGIIADEAAGETTIRLTNPGTYTISLATDNLKERQAVSKRVTVKENSGLYLFRDIRFGVNQAKNTVGCFFAADEQRVLLSKEITDADTGKTIDIGFFALNSDFDYCYFFSPDKARESAFPAIPGAIKTRVRNKPGGADTLTPEAFEGIGKSGDMEKYGFSQGNAGDYLVLDNLPLFVYFRTEDGRRGIIHLKEAVRNGAESYVATDIKMEKRPDD